MVLALLALPTSASSVSICCSRSLSLWCMLSSLRRAASSANKTTQLLKSIDFLHLFFRACVNISDQGAATCHQ